MGVLRDVGLAMWLGRDYVPAMAKASSGTPPFASLGPETFGDLLHRAYRRYKFTYGAAYDHAASAISEISPLSMQTLSRLELLEEKPTEVLPRMRAVLAILTYGFDPEEFGLSLDDLPSGLDGRSVRMTLSPARRFYGR